MKPESQPKSKLLSLIENFTLQDRRDINYFMQIPSLRLPKKDKSILLQLIDGDKAKILKKGDAYLDSLFKDVPNDKNKIKSRILKVLESYICFKEANSNWKVKNLLLARYYQENQTEKNLNSILNNGIRKLEKENALDSKVFEYWMYHIKIGLEKDIRQEDEKMDTMAGALDAFHALNRISVICEEASRSKILNAQINLDSYRSEIENLAKSNSSALFEIYQTLFNLIIHEEARYFDEMDDYLSAGTGQIDLELLKDFYTYLMNFCLNQINNGDLSYAKKYHDYIKLSAANNILLDNGVLGIGRLKNTILSSIIIKEMDWALDFLDEYSKYLSASANINRADFVLLNKAAIEIHRDGLEKCTTYIHEFQKTSVYYKDFYYKITCDKLLLKVHYELGNDEALLNISDSIKKYIRTQKKLSNERTEKHINFVNTIVSMVKKNNKKILKEKNEYLILDYLWFQKILKRNGRRGHS